MNTKKSSLFKKILKVSGISFLILLIVIVSLPFLFKNKIIQKVKDTINENLNAKVDFGQFDLSIISTFPDFKFSIEKVSVVGIKEFEKDTLAYIGSLGLNINLKSVLSGGPYKVNDIEIKDAKIHAIVLTDGKANWDIAKSSDTAKKSTDTTKVTAFKLQLKRFKIENAQIVYDDYQGKMFSDIKNLNYDLSGDFTQDVFDLNQNITIDALTYKMGGIAYLSNAKIKAKANMSADMPKMKFTFKENEFNINEFIINLDGYAAMPNDSDIVMDLKTSTNKNSFKSILSLIPAVYKKDFAGLQASGSVKFASDAKGTYNNHSYPSFNVELIVDNGKFQYPALPKSVNNVYVDLKINSPTSKLNDMVVNLNRLHIEMAGNPIDMKAVVKTPMTDVNFDAYVKGKIDLSSVKEFIPLEKGDELNGIIKADIEMAGKMSDVDKKQYDKFKAKGVVEINKMKYKTTSLPYETFINTMILNFTTQFVELKDFNATMGKSDFSAKGKIDNFLQYTFKNETLKGEFNFSSKLIDLNELTASTTTTAANTPTASSSSTMAVIDVPGNIDFTLSSTIDKILYQNMDITNLKGEITVREKRVTMHNISMNTLGGKLTMDGYYDTKNIKKPSVAFNFKVENFDIQKTFTTFNTVQKLAPIAQYAKGLFTATLDNFNVELNDKMEPDLNKVNARGVIKTNDIVVSGFEPFNKLADALKLSNLKTLNLQNLNLSYFIKDGRINFEPFVTKVNQISTNISGSTGLDQTIDYKWKMEVPKSMFGNQANSALNNLLQQANNAAGTNIQMGDKINVNVLFDGTVTKPTIKTGLKEELKNTTQEVKEQVTQVIVDKAKEEADKILKDAQDQVDKIKAEAQNLANQTKDEGYKSAADLENKGANVLEKMANKKLAEKLRKETDSKSQKIVDEANTRCDKIMQDARAKADEKLNKK